MFEIYLVDSYKLYELALEQDDDEDACRYLRASIFISISSIESLLNFIADVCEHGKTLEIYELAYLQDKKFELDSGEFLISKRNEFHRIEDKIKFLFKKYNSSFDFTTITWSKFKELKKFRDKITHPKEDFDDISKDEYIDYIKDCFPHLVNLMNVISKTCLSKPLRKSLKDFGDL